MVLFMLFNDTIKSCWSRNHIIYKNVIKFSLQINVSSETSFCNARRFYHREINEKVENRLKSADSLDKDYHLIYRAPLLNYIKLTYGVTFFTCSVFPPVLLYGLLSRGFGIYPVMLGDMEMIHSSFELLATTGAIVLVATQVSYTVFKYPLRIYHNASSGKYVAVYQHILPWKKSNEEFFAGEMKKVVNSYSLWHDCLYQIKCGRKAILLEDHFLLPKYFNDMLAKQ